MSADYPKVIHVGAVTVTVTDADDEARWLAKVPSAQLPVIAEPEPVADPVPAAEPTKKTKKK